MHTSRSALFVRGFLSVTFLLLAACGPPTEENRPPEAVLGDDRSVRLGERVVLDASDSSDPDGDSLVYDWSLSQPDGSSSAFVVQGETARFTPDVAGSYVVTVTVSDGEFVSPPAEVTLTATEGPTGNRAPLADPGTERSVEIGTLVELDGTGVEFQQPTSRERRRADGRRDGDAELYAGRDGGLPAAPAGQRRRAERCEGPAGDGG
jgi:hypothetical protein